VAGTEGSANVDIARLVSLIGSVTWLESRDETRGRALPVRPRLTMYGRAAVHVPGPAPLGRASAWIDVDYVSESHNHAENDLAITREVARAGVGASVELWEGALRIDVIVRDVFDARGRDALDQPLPGRSFALQIAVRAD